MPNRYLDKFMGWIRDISTGWIPSVRDRLKEDQSRRADHTPARVKELQTYFGDAAIFEADELVDTWEFRVTGWLYKVAPKRIEDAVTSLERTLSGITWLELSDLSPLDDLDTSELIRYHSIRNWYGQLRGYFVENSKTLMFFSILMLFWSCSFLSNYISEVPTELPYSTTDPGFAYQPESTGIHYLQLKGAPNSLLVLSAAESMFSSTVVGTESRREEQFIQQLEFGRYIRTDIRGNNSQIFRVQGHSGEYLLVDLRFSYGSGTPRIQVLNPELQPCDNPVEDEASTGATNIAAVCQMTSELEYYVTVQLDPDEAENQNATSSYMLAVSHANPTLVTPGARDESQLSPLLGTIMAMQLSDHGTTWVPVNIDRDDITYMITSEVVEGEVNSIALYQRTEDEVELVAYSASPVQISQSEFITFFTLGHGANYWIEPFVKTVNRVFGDSPLSYIPPENVAGIVLFLAMPLIFVAMLLIYILLDRTTTKRYGQSTLLASIGDVLDALALDSALLTAENRASLRYRIEATAKGVDALKKGPFSLRFGIPHDNEQLLDRIQSQISQTGDVALIPRNDSLPMLRNRVSGWFKVVLAGTYGSFPFEEDFELDSPPWHRKVRRLLRRIGVWNIIIISILLAVFLVTGLTLYEALLITYGDAVAQAATLVIRTSIMMFVVFLVYYAGLRSALGQRGDATSRVATFILFFFLPFFVMDILLNIGIIDAIVTILSNVSLF